MRTSLLDTNIVSQGIEPYPDEKVTPWLSGYPEAEAFVSVVSILELRLGIELLPTGRKQTNLESWLVTDIRRGYAGQILPVTEEIADRCGTLMAHGQKQGALPEQTMRYLRQQPSCMAFALLRSIEDTLRNFA